MIGATRSARYRPARPTPRPTLHRPARQAVHRPPPPPSRPWWPTLVSGAACCGLSFIVTLQAIAPKPPSTAAAALSHAFVSDSRTLIAAIKAAGLRGSHNVRGAIDTITRLGRDRVSVTGWADEGTDDAPLDVLVFVDGENKLTIQTEGRRVDTLEARGWPDPAPTHTVAFQGSLACAHGQRLMVVAVAESGDYGYFNPRVCP